MVYYLWIECRDRQTSCTVFSGDNWLRIASVIAFKSDEPQPIIGHVSVMYAQLHTDKSAVMQPSIGLHRAIDRLMYPIVKAIIYDDICTFRRYGMIDANMLLVAEFIFGPS